MRKIEELGWAGIAAVSVSVLGLGLGVLWYLVAPPLPVRKVEGGFAYIQPDPEQPVAADGWFAILGVLFGILMAVAFWMLLRKSRGPLQLAGLVLGALAAGYIAWKLGLYLEQSKYEEAMKAAAMEAIVDSPAKLAVTKVKACWPGSQACLRFPGGIQFIPALGVSLAYAVLAGWSRWPGLRPGEHYDDVSLVMAEDLADQAMPERPSPPAGDSSPAPGSSAPREGGWPDPPR